MKPDDYLLPHFTDWKAGYQAQLLRGFCEANELPSIRFHTLRACFATQLISSGIPATVVMKIAEWKDMTDIIGRFEISSSDAMIIDFF